MILKDLGSSEVLKSENQRKKILDIEDIERIVSQITKIPEKNISVNDRMYLKDLDKNLKRWERERFSLNKILWSGEQILQQLTGLVYYK